MKRFAAALLLLALPFLPSQAFAQADKTQSQGAADQATPTNGGDELPEDSVANVVFEAKLLTNIDVPSTLHYRFDMSGQGIEPAFVSKASMALEVGAEEGGKLASFQLFEGPNQRNFGPIQASGQNPMILVFLQRDVTQMGNLTGGSPGYFQQGLRNGFRGAGNVEHIDIDLEGQTIKVDKISIKPFENDPHIGRFPQFRDKTYSFWVGDDIPGGLYKIQASTPDPQSGNMILSESFTYERLER